MSKTRQILMKKFLEEFEAYLKEKNKRILSKTPKAIDNRGRFSVNGCFSGPLIKNKYLFQAWEKCKIKASSNYNKISSVNRKFCMDKNPTEQNVISPPGGFLLKLVDLEYNPEKLLVKIEPVKLNKNEKKLICLMYFCYYKPQLFTTKYCAYFNVKEAAFKETEAEFDFDGREKTMATWYKEHIFYLCAVTLNKNENVARWSETIPFNPDKSIDEQSSENIHVEQVESH